MHSRRPCRARVIDQHDTETQVCRDARRTLHAHVRHDAANHERAHVQVPQQVVEIGRTEGAARRLEKDDLPVLRPGRKLGKDLGRRVENGGEQGLAGRLLG